MGYHSKKQTPIKHNHIAILAKDWGSLRLMGQEKKICAFKRKKQVKQDKVRG